MAKPPRIGTKRRALVAEVSTSVADTIEPHQYERGWDLFSTSHNIAQIVTATGLTKNQLAWLIRVGDPDRGMPSYQSRMAELTVQIRKRAVDVADQMGQDAAQGLANAAKIAHAAQGVVSNTLAAHVEFRVKPAIQRMKSGASADDALADMAMPKEVRETLRVLRDYANFESIGRAWRVVFDSPHQIADALRDGNVRAARIDLSPETMLPAHVAVIEELPGGEGAIEADPLDVMPEWSGMTVEEIDRYMETGELPDHLYGDEPPVPLPPGAIDLDDEE